MPTDADPIVANWYEHLDKGQKFNVVAVDDATGVVEIQYFDGDVEEIDLEAWYLLDIEPIEEPEDWTGPMDDVERDDLGYTETGMQKEDWAIGMREIPPEESPPDEESDDWAEGFPEEEPWEDED